MVVKFYPTPEEALENAHHADRYVAPVECEGKTEYVAVVNEKIFDLCIRKSGESLKLPVYVKLGDVWQRTLNYNN